MSDNPLLSSLVEAWGGDETVYPDHQADPFPDETSSFAISEFVRLGRRYMAGVVTDHEFVDGIQIILGRLREVIDTHRSQWPLLPLSPDQIVIAQEAERAYFEFSEGLSEMVASFTQKDLPRVERGLEVCKRATLKMEAWHKQLVKLERATVMVVCSSCGRINGPLSQLCSHCQEELPGMDEEYDPDLDFVHAPKALDEFFQETLKAASGASPVSAWHDHLEDLRDMLLEIQDTIKSITAWDDRYIDLMPDIAKETDELTASLGFCLQALDRMEEFTTGHDLSSLDLGWFNLLWQFPTIHQNAYGLRLSLESLLEHMSSDDFGAFDDADGEYSDESDFEE